MSIKSETEPRSDFRLRPPPRDVRITSWPMRDHVVWSLVRLTLASLIGLVSWQATQSEAMGALAAGAMLLSQWSVWTPTRYHLGPHGIHFKRWGQSRRTLSWASIEGAQEGAHSLIVQTRLGNPSVIQIPYPSDRDELLEIVNYYLDVIVAVRSTNGRS